MNLKVTKPFTSEAQPSQSNVITAEIFYTLEVNGAAIDASESDNESPASATLRALQSLAPSPHIPTI